MILPNNGKVVIIDDKYAEVMHLMQALVKEKMPYLFFTDQGGDDLPIINQPIDSVRLVFLDLDLGIGGLGETEMIRIVQGRLERILKKNTPYVLVIWSNHEDRLAKELFREFDNGFKEYKPIANCSLDKSVISKSSINIVETIRDNLKKCLEPLKSFNVFLVWESIVNESSGRLTDNILSLYPPNKEWNDKTKFLLYKLAMAYSGKAVNSFPSEKQLRNALYTLTLTLTENIESSIDKVIGDSFKDLVSNKEQKIENFATTLNKLLLISDGNDDVTQPGNIFYPFDRIKQFRKDLDEKLEKQKKGISHFTEEKHKEALGGIERNYRSEKQKNDEMEAKAKKMMNEITVAGLNEDAYSNDQLKNEILANTILIELNITPLCDYAQEKAKLFRILPGVLIWSSYRQYLNINPSYIYTTDADFRIGGEDYLFLFDFRFLYSLDKKPLEFFIVKSRIKQQLLSDIQVKLSAHVNRSGVLYIE